MRRVPQWVCITIPILSWPCRIDPFDVLNPTSGDDRSESGSPGSDDIKAAHHKQQVSEAAGDGGTTRYTQQLALDSSSETGACGINGGEPEVRDDSEHDKCVN